jgi:hypothetical protein
VYDRAAIRIRGPHALTNFINPESPKEVVDAESPIAIIGPVSPPQQLEIDVAPPCDYDSGKESHNSVYSPISVLIFQPLELGTEAKTDWRSAQEGQDDFVLLDPPLLDDAFDSLNFQPIFLDDMSVVAERGGSSHPLAKNGVVGPPHFWPSHPTISFLYLFIYFKLKCL